MIREESLYGDKNLEKDFGLKLNPTPMQAKATVLQAPLILAGGDRALKITNGEWKVRKFYDTPGRITWFTIFIDDGYSRPALNRRDFESKFCERFVNAGQELGIDIGRPKMQTTIKGYHDILGYMDGPWKEEKEKAERKNEDFPRKLLSSLLHQLKPIFSKK